MHEPLEVIAPIVETKQDDRHLRMPATVIPHVLSQMETQCETRLDADARWLQACRNEGLIDPIDDAWVHNCKMAFDAVLRDPSLQTFVDPDPILWRLTNLADGHGLPPAAEGLGAWALAVWMHDDLRFSRFAHLSVEFFGRCLEAISQIVFQSPVGKLVCWRRRMDGAFCPQHIVEKDAQDLVTVRVREVILDSIRDQHSLLCSILQRPLHVPLCRGVPVCREGDQRIIWIFHLFSGRRRVGDCHWWLEHIGHHLWPGVTIRMLSLDTAVHPELGNLANGENYDYVRRFAQGGLIAGVLAGPPCETWSAARHIQLDDGAGPRPLRSAALPWSLPECTGQELKQSSMGTQLLMNTWTIEVAVVTNGGGAIMEHPWEHQQQPDSQDERASVWRTQAHQQWLMALPDAVRHYVEQYEYGAAGVKPTCLRALNLGAAPVVATALREGAETWRTRPTAALAGRNERGLFRTAAAKEYPSALCRSMVVALIRGLKARAHFEGWREPAACTAKDKTWLADAWSASAKVTRWSFLPDYQGA